MAYRPFFLLAVFLYNAASVYANCPYGIYESGLSQSDRDYIVNMHNDLRGQVASGKVSGQPKATNMKTMKYSMELEVKAQEVANTCEFAHVAIKGTSWGWVGQNIFLSMTTVYGKGSKWLDAIMYWYNEHKVYTFGSPFSRDTGHYTQLVWADSDNIGCGYAYYKKDGSWSDLKLYVCNYGPGGNLDGQNPYKT